MKRWISAILCAVLLCAAATGLLLPASAANEPCFMAINDRLLDLEEAYMPIAVSGLYYVPYTVFDNTATAINLGVYPIVNQTENTLSLYSKQEFLTFNLANGNSFDRHGQIYADRAVTRNGRVYLPARFVCEYFGLSYSSQTTQYGLLVRIRSASAMLSDGEFISQADQLMSDRLAKWQRGQGIAESAAPSQPSAGPSAGLPSPSSPSATPEQEDKSDVRAYLGVRHADGEGLDPLLGSLTQMKVGAIFFFSTEELAACDEAVRRVLCAGHRIGLLTPGSSSGEVLAAVEEGNAVLAQIAYLETRIVLAEGAEDAVLEELRTAGLLCWESDVDALPDGRTAARQANAVLQAASAYRYEVWLTMDDSAAGAALGGRVLKGLEEAQYEIRPVLEIEFD